jgi:hypothetical protein
MFQTTNQIRYDKPMIGKQLISWVQYLSLGQLECPRGIIKKPWLMNRIGGESPNSDIHGYTLVVPSESSGPEVY